MAGTKILRDTALTRFCSFQFILERVSQGLCDVAEYCNEKFLHSG